MGNTLNSADKPVFAATPTQTAVDLQAGADYTAKFANLRVGTNANRTALSGGQLTAGLHFFETDTNSEYVYNGGWVLWQRGWTTYTPAVTGWTLVGSAWTTAKYKVHRGVCTVRLVGTVQAMTSSPTVALPINASDSVTEHLHSQVAYIPNAGSEGIGLLRKSGSNSVVNLGYTLIASGAGYFANCTSTAPITFGTATSVITMNFSYDVG